MILFLFPVAISITLIAESLIRKKKRCLNRMLSGNIDILIGGWQFLTRKELCSLELVSHQWHVHIFTQSQHATMTLRQLHTFSDLTINWSWRWRVGDPPINDTIKQKDCNFRIQSELLIDHSTMRPPAWLRWNDIHIGPAALTESQERFLQLCQVQLASATSCDPDISSNERAELWRRMSLLASAQYIRSQHIGMPEPVNGEGTMIDDAERMVDWLHSPMPLKKHERDDAIKNRSETGNRLPMKVAKRRLAEKGWWRRNMILYQPIKGHPNFFITELDLRLRKRFLTDSIPADVPFYISIFGLASNGCAVNDMQLPLPGMPEPVDGKGTMVDDAKRMVDWLHSPMPLKKHQPEDAISKTDERLTMKVAEKRLAEEG